MAEESKLKRESLPFGKAGFQPANLGWTDSYGVAIGYGEERLSA